MKRICQEYFDDLTFDNQVVQIVHVLILKTIDLFFKAGQIPIDAESYVCGTLATAICKNRLAEDPGDNANLHPDLYNSSPIVEMLLEKGDLLMYPEDPIFFEEISKKTAILIAILSFQPEGINFWGVHYENEID